jgi:hypothetical protein
MFIVNRPVRRRELRQEFNVPPIRPTWFTLKGVRTVHFLQTFNHYVVVEQTNSPVRTLLPLCPALNC